MDYQAETKYLLLTDIASSSSLKTSHPERWAQVRAAHDALVDGGVESEGGVLANDRGDGAYYMFDSAPSAVRVAIAIQRALGREAAEDEFAFPDGRRLRLRIVLHGGPLRRMPSGKWDGAAFDLASRVEELAGAGQVLLSAVVVEAMGQSLPEACALEDQGRYELRGIPDSTQLFQLNHPEFWQPEGGHPALRERLLPPNNLPQEGTRFIGRTVELSSLTAFLRSSPPPRLVTISAPGGYGKTRLALEACAIVLPDFPDGVWHVPLETITTAEGLATSIAQALSLQLSGADPPLEQLCRWLVPRKLLLYLDNFEQLIAGGGAEVVARMISAAAGVQILITSRQRLELLGEQHFPLEPLPEAVELFADRATFVKPGFALDAATRPRVEQLCALLHRVPLGIVLTAAWADLLSLDEMLVGIDELLTEDTPALAGLPGRQRSLRASHDWGWRLLEEPERQALLQLSVMRSGWFGGAAAAVLGESRPRTLALLSGLLRRSWLRTSTVELAGTEEHTRYDFINPALHEYVTWQAGGQLANAAIRLTAVQTEARQRHAQHFAALSGELSPLMKQGGRQAEAYRRFSIDRENFSAACEQAVSEQAGELLVPLEDGYVDFLRRTSNYIASLSLMQRFLAARQALEDQHGAAGTLGKMGIVHWSRGEYERALELYAQSVAVYRWVGDEDGTARTLNHMATVHFSRGDYGRALELYEQSLEAKRRIGDELGTAQTLGNIGLIHKARGEYDQALELYSQSLEVKHRLGDERGAATTLHNMGLVYYARRDYDQALRLYEASLDVELRLGDEHGAAQTLNNMGLVHEERGEYDLALELYAQSLDVKRRVGDERGEAATLHNMGLVHYSRGNYGQAQELYAQGLEIMHRLGDEQAAAVALGDIGKLHQSHGDYDLALELYAQSLGVSRRLGDRPGMAETFGNMGAVYRAQSRYAEARGAWTEAEEKYRSIGLADKADEVAGWLLELPA